jgi:hypothetical protein
MRFLVSTVTPYPTPVFVGKDGAYPEAFASAASGTYS